MRKLRHKPVNLIIPVPATTRLSDTNRTDLIVSCENPPYPFNLVSGRYHLDGVVYGFIIHVLR
jgi:hypothetical protein